MKAKIVSSSSMKAKIVSSTSSPTKAKAVSSSSMKAKIVQGVPNDVSCTAVQVLSKTSTLRISLDALSFFLDHYCLISWFRCRAYF